MGLTGVTFLVTLMMLTAVTIPANGCSPADQAALMDFKAALNEPYLGIFNTWTGTNCCQGWNGVSCDPNTQRVADIVLRGESEDPIYEKAGRSGYMTGSLSPSLCKLDGLTTLIVADWKDISGELPACLTSLKNLRIVDLIGNKITGQIPANIGQLSKLAVLNLADNQISGSIPGSIVNLGKLMHLELSNNQISGEIPSDIGKLSMMSRALLNKNKLTGSIPNSISKLYRLADLDLAMNQITGSIPAQLGSMPAFVVLMRSSRSETIRRLIVDCIVQMIKSKVGSIKSGWRSVFMIFTAAADDDLEPIVESAFENVEQVILEHFDQVVGDCFMDCVNCLIRFANNKTSHRISLKAIALLRICEDRLAEGLIPGGALKPVDTSEDVTYDVTEHFWFPMLAGLSDLTSDPRPEVRNCALEVLFDLLNERGGKFSSTFWENIFHRVLFPIFDHVRHAGKENLSSTDEWPRESSIHSLQLLCNLFNTFYKNVCFMLPPLLGLLLDCAQKSDQSVVAISLGALVHLIEVGGHQFSYNDWDTLLESIRNASYATQPLELLNDLGFENSKHHTVLHNIAENGNGGGHSSDLLDDNRGTDSRADLDETGGMPSPSGRLEKPTVPEGLERSQTIGQKIMGNMMDNRFIRSFTSKPKIQASDNLPTSPSKLLADDTEPEARDEDESSMLATIRSKCITQLLLLSAIDSIQKKYWNKLKPTHKITIMDILFSVLEFAASYNSYSNLRLRMRQIPAERPPFNLLRQELAGTSIYLDILQKTTDGINSIREESTETTVAQKGNSLMNNDAAPNDKFQQSGSIEEDKFQQIAEEKLVSFCGQVLREASDFQSCTAESANMDVHRVLELRSPIIVKVLRGMCFMNSQIFRSHLREFYPLITKLVCCDQMDVRGSLADLFNMQLNPLLA